MTETISTALIAALEGTIAIAQDQDGTEDMPYAVYTLDVSPSYVKGKVYKISGVLTVRIYAASASQALTLSDAVEAAIELSMQNAEYRTRVTSATSYDDNGKYQRILEYSVAQVLTAQQTQSQTQSDS